MYTQEQLNARISKLNAPRVPRSAPLRLMPAMHGIQFIFIRQNVYYTNFGMQIFYIASRVHILERSNELQTFRKVPRPWRGYAAEYSIVRYLASAFLVKLDWIITR